MKMDYRLLYYIASTTSLDDGTIIPYQELEFRLTYDNLTCNSEAIAFMEDKEKRKGRILIRWGLSEEERRSIVVHEIVEICLIQF
jgi:hypothetical protein